MLVVGTMAQGNADTYVPNEVLVKFDSSPTTRRSAERRLVNEGASLIEKLGDDGWEHFRIPDGVTVEQAMLSYQNFDGVLDDTFGLLNVFGGRGGCRFRGQCLCPKGTCRHDGQQE